MRASPAISRSPEVPSSRSPLKNTGVLSHSQAFSVVRGSAWQCVAAWRESGADVVLSRKLTGWGCTWAYIPIQADEGSAADDPLSRQVPQMRPYHKNYRYFEASATALCSFCQSRKSCASLTPSRVTGKRLRKCSE